MDKYQLKLEVDATSDMGYVWLTPYEGNPTGEQFFSKNTKGIEATPLAIDRNDENRIVGIEIHNVTRVLPEEYHKSRDLELIVNREQETARISFKDDSEREIENYPFQVGFNKDTVSYVIVKDIQNSLLGYFSKMK